MKRNVAISIVVPAYNEEKLIDRCLTSLLSQDFNLPYEIIVVDNNSTDQTSAIAQKYNVRIIQESRQGVVFARQKGLTCAVGKIVASVDCDATYPNSWLAILYESFYDSHTVAVAGTPTMEANPYWAYFWYKSCFYVIKSVYGLTGYLVYVGAYNFAFRRQTFLDLGGYRTYLDAGGDELDPLSRLRICGKVMFNPKLKMKISARRYRQGFFKSMLIDGIYYYYVSYLLAKIFKHTSIRNHPIRE